MLLYEQTFTVAITVMCCLGHNILKVQELSPQLIIKTEAISRALHCSQMKGKVPHF